jgi:hypothetical protein
MRPDSSELVTRNGSGREVTKHGEARGFEGVGDDGQVRVAGQMEGFAGKFEVAGDPW